MQPDTAVTLAKKKKLAQKIWLYISQVDSLPKELSVQQTGWEEVMFRRSSRDDDDGDDVRRRQRRGRDDNDNGRDNGHGDGRRRYRQSRHGGNDDGDGSGHRCQRHGHDEEVGKDDEEEEGGGKDCEEEEGDGTDCEEEEGGGKGCEEEKGDSCRRHRYEQWLQQARPPQGWQIREQWELWVAYFKLFRILNTGVCSTEEKG